jgi:hypothetical protein
VSTACFCVVEILKQRNNSQVAGQIIVYRIALAYDEPKEREEKEMKEEEESLKKKERKL